MILVFGGAFNPPTTAHHAIAKHLLKELPGSTLAFVPVGDGYAKPGLVPVRYRIQMLEILSRDLPRTLVSPVEAQAASVLSTLETMRLLQQDWPGGQLAFVLGADNLEKLTEWKEYRSLLTEFLVVAFKRGDLDVPSLIESRYAPYKDRFVLVEGLAKIPVSSTQYRKDRQAAGLVLPGVESYIRSHGLYGRKKEAVSGQPRPI